MLTHDERVVRSAQDSAAGLGVPRQGPAASPAQRIRGAWRRFWMPSAKYSLGFLVIVAFGSGILFWGGFNTAMELTNTETFCISCHEMQSNVYREYQQTIHYTNRSGVRAVCTDCHVPKDWYHKTIRKIQASAELYHWAMGSIDTRDKFVAKRLLLAEKVWTTMKSTDSRECRNCHDLGHMDFATQEKRSADKHQASLTDGKTCIDCHRGIAHKLPAGSEEAYAELERHFAPKLAK